MTETDTGLGNGVLLADALATISTLLTCPKLPKNLISCSWVTVGGRLPTKIVQSSVTLRSTDICGWKTTRPGLNRFVGDMD